MVQTPEDVERVHEIANQLKELGAPQKTVDRVHHWANDEKKRLRDKAWGLPRKSQN
jgi:hypothetical protein